MLVAYETQKHVPKYNKLHKYHESAVINLTTILAVLLSTICQAIVIIFHLNNQRDGLLLMITLRDCLWMFPMIYLLFIPKVLTFNIQYFNVNYDNYCCRSTGCIVDHSLMRKHEYLIIYL